jgi:hypothetical protein
MSVRIKIQVMTESGKSIQVVFYGKDIAFAPKIERLASAVIMVFSEALNALMS